VATADKTADNLGLKRELASLLAKASRRPPDGERRLVTQIFASWNPLTSWLRQVERLRHEA